MAYFSITVTKRKTETEKKSQKMEGEHTKQMNNIRNNKHLGHTKSTAFSHVSYLSFVCNCVNVM